MTNGSAALAQAYVAGEEEPSGLEALLSADGPCLGPIAIACVVFLAIHVWAQRAFPDSDAYTNTAIGRGAAATILCVMGAIGMAGNSHHAGRGFVPVEGTEVDQRYLALPQRIALGHFVADLLWLVYAKQRYAQAPRKDLVAHHLLCLLGYTYMMDTPGALLASTAMTAELMPVTSFLGALGKATGNKILVHAAPAGRLASLVLWRVPMWSVMVYHCIKALTQGSTGEMRSMHIMGILLGVSIVSMDTHWTKKCIKRVASGKGCAVPALEIRAKVA